MRYPGAILATALHNNSLPGASIDTEFVFVTTGSAGDLFPFLRMAVTLRERGCKVRLVAPELHAAMVHQAGVVFHGTCADPAVLDDKHLWHPLRGFAVVWRAVRPGLRELPRIMAQLAPGAPCVIIAHPLALHDAVLARDQASAPLAHERTWGASAGVPGAASQARRIRVVAAYLAPSNIPTVHDPLMLGPWRVPRWVPHGLRRWLWRQIAARVIDPVVLPDINTERSGAHLPPVDSLLALMRTGPDLSVTLFPPWFGPRQPDWPRPLACGDFALFDPDPAAQFPPDVDHFLRDGGAPLVFTHGTGNRQAQHFFAAATEATLALGRRAIFLTPHRDQLPPQLPPHILWQPYLPLRRCLEQAALLVHHGGIGTTAEALHAGVAQLVVPMAFDQFDNGARVVALGAGRMLAQRRLSARSLTAELSILLAPHAVGTAGAAGRLGKNEAWDTLMDAIAAQGN